VASDGTGRGFFNASGSHSLEQIVNNVARDVEDPETKLTLWKRAQARAINRGSKEVRSRPDLRIPALGSGSD
jgi:N-acetylated-alpha-linked acidic dipeptidase